MENQEFCQWLINNDACGDSLKWLQGRTARQAWDDCGRADWLLWWAAKAKINRKLLVRVACQCARRALRFTPEGELRPLLAIEAAEAWCQDKTTIAIAEVRKAADAAYAYAATAEAAYAAHSAASAAASAAEDEDDAASATAADAYATDAAVYSAHAAAYATDAAASDRSRAARREEHIAMCSIVRQYIPFDRLADSK